jgi:predicted AAA+ superfamily ATPase
MIHRKATKILSKRLAEYPAVALLGPRQSGKTTLAKTFSTRYYDLEQEQDRIRMDIEWDSIVESSELVILDEAQEVPEVFTRLRGAIDADRKRFGKFLITGSISANLMYQVFEILAGRIALVNLAPLAASELAVAKETDLWTMGGYPDGGILNPSAFGNWQRNYLQLLAERDLPKWGLTARPAMTLRLMKMLAALHGDLWNASKVGQSLGIDAKTVNTYVDFLEGTYLIRRLPPYFANIKKRLVKSPKVYWRDSGLLHALLNIQSYEQLLNQPWVGASWEGFVIEQIAREISMQDIACDLYHFRTSDQYEIDLVMEIGGELWSIEIKLSASPSESDFRRLNKTADLIGSHRRFLISKIKTPILGEYGGICSLDHFISGLSGYAS